MPSALSSVTCVARLSSGKPERTVETLNVGSSSERPDPVMGGNVLKGVPGDHMGVSGVQEG